VHTSRLEILEIFLTAHSSVLFIKERRAVRKSTKKENKKMDEKNGSNEFDASYDDAGVLVCVLSKAGFVVGKNPFWHAPSEDDSDSETETEDETEDEPEDEPE
jgi:hypothetical protein